MYEFENDDMIDFEGVDLQGYVESTYDELVDIFGDPTIGDDMTNAKWVLQFKMPLDEEGYSQKVKFEFTSEGGVGFAVMSEFLQENLESERRTYTF